MENRFLKSYSPRQRVIDESRSKDEGRAFGWLLRGDLADECHRLDAVARNGPQAASLTLTKDDEVRRLLQRGPVVHAAYSVEGDPAVFKIPTLDGGNFQLNFEGKTTETSTQLNTQGLLMEGLRLLDESNRDSGEKAEEEDVLLDT